ncbi:MAG TPA: hypothetical protein VFB12_19615 [Ktedonobacteraceae bacterium]|nr:hypothetical protein [Ktedonobacteraceae bacterium]
MHKLNGVRAVIFPASNIKASITAWTDILGYPPAYQTPDFAAFLDGDIEIGLSRLAWVDQPLVLWKVEDIEEAHRLLVATGARAMVEGASGLMVEFGTTEIANGDPATGIVDVPGRRLAVLKSADGNLIGILQDMPTAWS